MTSVWLRYLTGADIDALGVTDADIVGAVEDVLADHGRGQVVFEPRTHLVPDNGGKGHFNILRGHLSAKQVSGVKVVGDFVGNFERGLPSEMALILSTLRNGSAARLYVCGWRRWTSAKT